MRTKDNVLMILEERRGQAVSGADMARKLDISRNAVWKAVNTLKKDGYRIESATKVGYRLCKDNDILSIGGILPFLSGANHDVRVYEKVESTNILAKEILAAELGAKCGALHGTVVVANEQTAGRGRHGRMFFSPPGHGIYMSLILSPDKLGFDTPTVVTAYTAVVVSEAIQALCGKSPHIKWVNDLFLRQKKCCGISAEAETDLTTGTIQWLVVGIGINFTETDLPEALRAIAGAVYKDEEPSVTRSRLAAEIINRLLGPAGKQADIIERYRQRLFILGKKVRVEGVPEPYEATALDVDEAGRLLVRNKAGEIVTLFAGEISIRF